MKKLFYIFNVITNENYDPIENKFYPGSWEPEREEKEYLQQLIESDPEKFENCIITD
jgi:hypothetical protein